MLLRNFEPGELVGAGLPVVTLGNPDSLWVRVYVAAPQVSRIRRKIESDPRQPSMIITVRGDGYMFTPEVAVA